MSKKKNINQEGIIGTGKGLVNQNSRAFKALQKTIRARFEELNESEKRAHQLLSQRLQKENYLRDKSTKYS